MSDEAFHILSDHIRIIHDDEDIKIVKILNTDWDWKEYFGDDQIARNPRIYDKRAKKFLSTQQVANSEFCDRVRMVLSKDRSIMSISYMIVLGVMKKPRSEMPWL